MSEGLWVYLIVTTIVSAVGTIIWWVARADSSYFYGKSLDEIPAPIFAGTNALLVLATYLFPLTVVLAMVYGLIYLPKTVAYWRTNA